MEAAGPLHPRFAAHLGVRAPDRPLFAGLAGSNDPIRQLRFIAAQGFAGTSDNFALLRDDETQSAIGAEAARLGLEMGSIVHDPLNWNQPIWNTVGATARQTLLERLEGSLAAAMRLHGATLNCVTGRAPDLSRSHQLQAMAENLQAAAEIAAKRHVTLCLEVTHPDFAPGALLERLDEALLLIEQVGHPNVKLNFDIGHIALHGLDVVEAVERSAGVIGMVQAADVPGRVEPGAGRLPWPAIFGALHRAGYAGLVELELEPSIPGVEGETALLERLRLVAGGR
jgi:hydroxypyruvate isomerase